MGGVNFLDSRVRSVTVRSRIELKFKCRQSILLSERSPIDFSRVFRADSIFPVWLYMCVCVCIPSQLSAPPLLFLHRFNHLYVTSGIQMELRRRFKSKTFRRWFTTFAGGKTFRTISPRDSVRIRKWISGDFSFRMGRRLFSFFFYLSMCEGLFWILKRCSCDTSQSYSTIRTNILTQQKM